MIHYQCKPVFINQPHQHSSPPLCYHLRHKLLVWSFKLECNTRVCSAAKMRAKAVLRSRLQLRGLCPSVHYPPTTHTHHSYLHSDHALNLLHLARAFATCPSLPCRADKSLASDQKPGWSLSQTETGNMAQDKN